MPELCKKLETNFTIVRPPLIFHPELKPILRLIKLIKLQLPMPFGSIKNKYHSFNTSIIYQALFINAFLLIAPDNMTFVITDYITLSTNELITILATYEQKSFYI